MTATSPAAGQRGTLTLALLVMGVGWGLTQPLVKIAVTGGHHPFGLVFWQLTFGALVLTAINLMRGRRLRWDARALAIYLFIALAGTILPNSASYRAALHLPSGIMSVVIATVPMIAFPMALLFGTDRFSLRRLAGLCLGIAGVALIALPGESLPDPAMAAFLPLALVAPTFYALEGNVVAKWGTDGIDAVEILQGASILGAVIMLPVVWVSGTMVDLGSGWGVSEWALLGLSVIHALVYSGYVWLVGRAGAVFAAQVAYLVTGCGVIWAMILLQERYSAFVWLAIAVILEGVGLVRPRDGGGANGRTGTS